MYTLCIHFDKKSNRNTFFGPFFMFFCPYRPYWANIRHARPRWLQQFNPEDHCLVVSPKGLKRPKKAEKWKNLKNLAAAITPCIYGACIH